MTQKTRSARPIPDKEFADVSEEVLRKNKDLLQMLAKV